MVMEGEWWRKHLLVVATSTFCNYVYTNKQGSEMKMTEGPFKLCT